jgi:hypothetical protein
VGSQSTFVTLRARKLGFLVSPNLRSGDMPAQRAVLGAGPESKKAAMDVACNLESTIDSLPSDGVNALTSPASSSNLTWSLSSRSNCLQIEKSEG